MQTYRLQGLTLRLPTLFEILRIKSYLLLFRNMARDYADCHALSSEWEDPELTRWAGVCLIRYPAT